MLLQIMYTDVSSQNGDGYLCRSKGTFSFVEGHQMTTSDQESDYIFITILLEVVGDG